MTRGQLLKRWAAAAGLAAASHPAVAAARTLAPADGAAAAELGVDRVARGLSFRTRPDLRPPLVRASVAGVPQSTAEGFCFLGPTSHRGAQAGSLIIDASGDPVWFRPVHPGLLVSNFRVQQYRGEPVLAWWEGTVLGTGYGQGEGILVDGEYREVARVRAARGRHIDMHEFVLTPQGTALFTCYPEAVTVDLSRLGGSSTEEVFQSVIQEVDVASGRLLFEWRSLDHVPVAESYAPLGGPYDYLHANSINVTPDGDLLVGARHTWTVYKLERRTGRVLWRLGGKRSDFAMGPRTSFAWQHDARHLPGDVITLFDDGAGPRTTHRQSRGLALQLDHRRRTVTLRHEYTHPRPLLAFAMGSVQALADGNVMIGWGNVPLLSEFDSSGALLRDYWSPWRHASYRGFRLPWSGVPREPPRLVVEFDRTSAQNNAFVSWNGATGVAAWQVSIGPSASGLRPIGVARRSGFETAIALGSAQGYAAVTALDAGGNPLATSPPVKLQ